MRYRTGRNDETRERKSRSPAERMPQLFGWLAGASRLQRTESDAVLEVGPRTARSATHVLK
jgi:hypothetical protein